MIRRLTVLRTGNTDPYHNLALEELLLHSVAPGQCILYLWQNQHTVVIGRNQHAANECRIRKLEADGGHLARRLSGGGAVYHDLGNLNFTFLVPTGDYDLARQNEVILSAVQAVGVRAEKSGRNDLTVEGKKFSGHAFYRTGDRSYHHGTLMVAVDKAIMSRYLNVSPLKLQAKGVASVKSRVANLTDYLPGLTIAALSDALVWAFSAVYGLPVEELREQELDAARLAEGIRRFASPEWKYGDCRPLEISREARFDWGTVRLDYTLADGVIAEAALWSDGLEADYLSAVPALLRGCALTPQALAARLAPTAPDASVARDLAGLVLQKEE